ncbi:espin [Euwallacea fornicatus]|uniref:espin n=1 Tax=Euwallacea fornicatus TaxID=995702 RepID=UPI00338FC46D
MVKQKKRPIKPAWLKEWTISKGWVHNRSHMLSLRRMADDGGQKRLEEDISDSSSVSNVEELISIISNLNSQGSDQESSSKEDAETMNLPRMAGKSTKNLLVNNGEDMKEIFDQISENYRENFKTENHQKYSDLDLPTIYKERLLAQQGGVIKQMWKGLKQLHISGSKSSPKYNCKFTVNQLYGVTEDKKEIVQNTQNPRALPVQTVQRNTSGKNSLGRNIALFNTLNSKSNIHEDAILECSDESNFNSLNYIYYNPVYASDPSKPDLNSNKEIVAVNRSFSSSPNQTELSSRNFKTNRYQVLPYPRDDPLKYKSKSDKYVIRHVRIRIMLSLRIGKKMKNIEKKKHGISEKFSEMSSQAEVMRRNINRTHEEQRRIGNGRTSIKIQNMRYGRLNVLRWLLWEAESKEGSTVASCGAMPALEKGGASPVGDSHHGAPNGNATLALHYAAARGCLDCVRLLVDSSAELSANTQMDNDVTPVYLAAQEGHLDVLKFLVLEAGGSLYVRAKDGMAPIHAASQMGCLNCVKWMIQEQGVDPNLRDGDGATPLHFAASRGHLDTVRWLLKHGAKLSLDKYGKSPINDAAENQQVECLNVLVQHGTTPDYNDSERSSNGKVCACTTRKTDHLKRGNSSGSDCSTCMPKQTVTAARNSKNSQNPLEPFYLHPPLNGRSLEPAHAPENGLYINPMANHRHSASTCSEDTSSIGSESFYLHNPNEVSKEVVYNRVKGLFESNGDQRSLSALKVKVEVHSSSSGAGSDENLSSSDLSSVRSNDQENDYEDIYLVREEARKQDKTNVNGRSRSRDSGSHSRSGSISSSNSGCNVIVKVTPNGIQKEKNGIYKSNEFLPKPQKMERVFSDKKVNGNHEKGKLVNHISPPPIETLPPPPPPPPPNNPHASENGDLHLVESRGAEIVEIVEEPTLKPSDIVKGMCRSMSALSARRLNSSCSDLTIVSLNEEERYSTTTTITPTPSNRQRVLPFVPPSFPIADPNKLIKPSEYLRSISGGEKRPELVPRERKISREEEPEEVVEESREISVESSCKVVGPPPPPLPEFNGDLTQTAMSKQSTLTHQEKAKKMQPLSAISIQDLNSVQLRRTEKVVASKTFSAPTRSVSLQCLNTADSFTAQKTDLIAELKMSKDLTGLKKMKIEKAKTEESMEKEVIFEIRKQFTANNFVDKIPDRDNTGNAIPAWKRQMLAKKAAEKAKREMEQQMLRDAEERRLQSIPQWKRQLLAKKEETENKIRQTIYTPKVVEEPKLKLHHEFRQQQPYDSHANDDDKIPEDINNNNSNEYHKINNSLSLSNNSLDDSDPSDEEPNIIPWRSQLRKTNSSLNLLC